MKTKILHAALFTPLSDGRWGLPLLLWGPPGIAKTAAVKGIGDAMGVHVEHLTPGERGEGAFGVTPVPLKNADGSTVMTYPPPDWVEKFKTEDGQEVGVVFFDEVNTAPPALQPALLGGIQERRIGGHTFGKRVRVLGAANPVGHAAGGWDLAAPVANRLGHLDWPTPEGEEWADWLMTGGTAMESADMDAEEARVMEEWPEAFAKAAGQVASFIRRRPDLLHRMPDDGDPAQSRAWPSPRTWEYATRAMASGIVHGLSEVDADELISAFVGVSVAAEFATWKAELDLPSPSEVLDEQVSFDHDPRRLDRTEVVLSACAALLVPKGDERRMKRAEVLWGLLAKIMEDAKDVCVPAMTTLVKNGLQKTPKARPVLAKMHSVVSAAGMVGGR